MHRAENGIRILLLWFALLLLPEAGWAQQWVPITTTGASVPPPRYNAAAIYDPRGHRLVIFGGRTDTEHLNDVWTLDLHTYAWTEHTPSTGPAPAPRFTPGGVYDARRHQMVIWSGQGDGFLNDVWAFDLASYTWSELAAPDPRPNPRYGVASIFDPQDRSLVTFAGFTDAGRRFDDTWRFDVEDAAWINITPAQSPPRRCLHTASYDAREHRMIVYGGQQSGPLDDLWSFDLTTHTWTDLTPPERPQGRFFATSVYDSLHHRLIVFGGNQGSGTRTDDVWAFDLSGNRWHEIIPSGPGPNAREGAVAVYIEAEDRMIVFGGRGDQFFNDVWALEDLALSTDTAPEADVPQASFVLHQNHPNPVRRHTSITYELRQPARVVLALYDVLGRERITWIDGPQAAGLHTLSWDGRDALGRAVPSGLYVYVLRADDITVTEMLTLVR